MKNISPAGKFPDQTCPGLRHRKPSISFHRRFCCRPALTKLSETSKKMAERIMKCVSLGLGQDLAFLEKMHQGMLSQDKGGEVMEIMISTRYGKTFMQK